MTTPWTLTFKTSFLSDLVDLPKNLQQSVAKANKELEADPISPRGDTIKKLTGWKDLYRYRLGDFRLVYAAKPDTRVVQLLAVGPRSDIYRGDLYSRFNYEGWDKPDAAVEFGPELAAAPEWQQHPEWLRPDQPAETQDQLPRSLTTEQLARWLVPPEFHAALLRCRTLQDLTNAEVPEPVRDRVFDVLYSPTADQLAAQPDLRLFDAEDLLRYAEGTLAGFLLHLDEQQEPLTRWALAGPTLVKGGPGSGKSTVALYRVRALVAHFVAENGRVPDVLFTTYTNALTNTSQSLLGQLLSDVLGGDKVPKAINIATFHKRATHIVKSCGVAYTLATPQQELEALHAARAALQPRAFGDAALIPIANALAPLRDDYLLEEFAWVIEGQDCRTEAAYLAADRTGRGISFGAARRQAVWKLYELFSAHLLDANLFTWGHLTQAALDLVRSGDFATRWDYVLIDEAQDLPPAALALAVELCRSPQGVFLTADANQSLYNRGFRWRNVHESLQLAGRTRVLRRNYRSTRQIAAAAAEILAPIDDADGEAVRQEYAHSGPRPVIYAAQGETDQWRWIARQISEAARELRLPASAAAVLVSSSSIGGPLALALSDHGLRAQFMKSNEFKLDTPGVKVTTLHAAKGLEFPIVVVAHVEAGRIPRETEATDPDELAALEEAERRLLFVGCTRAMRRLFITYNRGLPSPFLAGLREEHWAREETAVSESAVPLRLMIDGSQGNGSVASGPTGVG